MFHMAETATFDARSLDDLRQDLAGLVRDGSPAIGRLAQWALDHPQEMAFHSVRGLAELSGANVNSVYRLSVALGFSGYEDCRRAFQAALRQNDGLYGARAAELTNRDEESLIAELHDSAHANLVKTFAPGNVEKIKQAAQQLLAARQVFCVGLRSSFSLAHYFSYMGGMAFQHFERPLVETGSVADTLAKAGPEDVVVLITFSLYSAEVVRAHEAAIAKGMQVIAITDSYVSPIAAQAEIVFSLPMAGPQTLPSHGAGFALVEGIISEMIKISPEAPARIAEFERQLIQLGSYVPSEGQG